MSLNLVKKAYKNSVDFIHDVEIALMNEARNFIRGCYNHFESIVILGLSSVGLSSLLGEIPFYWSVPMWLEGPMVIPVASVLLIVGIVKLAEWRSNRRNRVMLASVPI